ncbi:MAG: hypothetical protein VCD50_04440 [Alphaproteobacteria bacterium]
MLARTAPWKSEVKAGPSSVRTGRRTSMALPASNSDRISTEIIGATSMISTCARARLPTISDGMSR